MNRSRRNMMGLAALALAIATAGRARAQEASPAKVHGTITVDFDKVTISELLKLVSVVEKVDGTIHIVSSKAGDGENALIVSGANGAIALSRPDQPAAPKVVIGTMAPRSPAPAIAAAVHPQSPPSPRFPPLAALGRLLGLGGRSSHVHPPAAPGAPRVIPLEIPDAGVAASPAEEGEPIALGTGSILGSLAEGKPLVFGSFHSPWPKSERRDEPKADGEVSRASSDQTAAPAPAPKHLVAKGDSFEGLARQYYGDARYARALWWANRERAAWPEALTEGKRLVVPSIGELEPRMVLAASGSGTRSAVLPELERIGPRRDPQAVPASFTEAASKPSASPESGGVAVHVVRPDDTLRIIAREKCGDERKALEIMSLNRDALSRDGRPRVGQCLILPAPSSAR